MSSKFKAFLFTKKLYWMKVSLLKHIINIRTTSMIHGIIKTDFTDLTNLFESFEDILKH